MAVNMSATLVLHQVQVGARVCAGVLRGCGPAIGRWSHAEPPLVMAGTCNQVFGTCLRAFPCLSVSRKPDARATVAWQCSHVAKHS